jgi:hypothetical protein
MASGIISVATIPGWPSPVAGVMEELAASLVAGGFAPPFIAPDGVHVGDVTTAQNFLNGYSDSATQLQWNKWQMQTALDALLDNNFDLKAFIRAGTSTAVTAANVGTFLATIVDNYRSLRASIAAATTMAQLQAININSGWPNNP